MGYGIDTYRTKYNIQPKIYLLKTTHKNEKKRCLSVRSNYKISLAQKVITAKIDNDVINWVTK